VSISDDELGKHRVDGKQWNDFKDMSKSRNIPIDRSSWVHKRDFKKQKLSGLLLKSFCPH